MYCRDCVAHMPVSDAFYDDGAFNLLSIGAVLGLLAVFKEKALKRGFVSYEQIRNDAGDCTYPQ